MTFDLQAFQEAFVKKIIWDISESESLGQQVIPTQNHSPQEALRVYQKDYQARLTDVLVEVFSSVHFILGDTLFYPLCHDYLKAYPSQSFDLGDYGQNFPDFLQSDPRIHKFPYCRDLASLELDLRALAHQAWETPAASVNLEQPEFLCFEFISALKIIQSPYPLLSLRSWQKNPEVKINFAQGEDFCIFKTQVGVRSKKLSQIQVQIFWALAQGQSLGNVLDGLALSEEPLPLQNLSSEISELFAFFSHEGLIRSSKIVAT